MFRRFASWTSAWLLLACGPAEHKPTPVDVAQAVYDLEKEAPWITDPLGVNTYVFCRPLESGTLGTTQTLGDHRQIRIDLDQTGHILVVTAHEIGHAMGLDHSPDPYSVMYPTSPRIEGVRAVAESLAAECASQPVGCQRLRVLVEIGGSSR